MKAKAVKNTFDAKESLKLAGFVWNSEDKSWDKEFASQEEFDAWYNDYFTNLTYAGRKAARFNNAVVFEFVTEAEEVIEEVEESAEESVNTCGAAAIELLKERLTSMYNSAPEQNKSQLKPILDDYLAYKISNNSLAYFAENYNHYKHDKDMAIARDIDKYLKSKN